MNQSHDNDTEALRSDIDVTRRRMDDTIDALGNRMQPRHLLDEVLGYFRRSDHNGGSRLTTMRTKVSQGADAAVHAVIDTVKSNPMPALLIGAGVAWMIYESRRDKTGSSEFNYATGTDEGIQYDPDAHIDRPLDYPSSATGISEAGWSDESGSKLGNMKGALSDKVSAARDKLGETASAAREKMSAIRHVAGEKLSVARERAGQLGSRVKERGGEVYFATRQRVATTADEHPLVLGLCCLAAGVLAGLAAPTPSAVDRKIGPTADRLRERARETSHEMLEKGKRVASAAVSAVKEEAQAQGLTPESLRDKATAVADRAREAGRETARNEGLTSGTHGSTTPGAGQSGASSSDPTITRPAV